MKTTDKTKLTCFLCKDTFWMEDPYLARFPEPVPKYTSDLKDPKTWQIAAHLYDQMLYDPEEVWHPMDLYSRRFINLCPTCRKRVNREMPEA